jgi:lambda repressor-like predicted transcriptional regulator
MPSTKNRWPPHPIIARLRERGWTMQALAEALGASPREVYRWAAGDSRPIGVYERALARLDASSSAA